MNLGRLHLSGPGAWPDHVLEVGHVAGFVLAIGRIALGFELRRSQFARAFWVSIYAGFWCFEIYLDLDDRWKED